MPVMLLCLVVGWSTASPRLTLTLEGAAEIVAAQRSTGIGDAVDGVFGVRVLLAPEKLRYVAASLDFRVGTLGAKAEAGTTAVNVASTDMRSDLLLHLRWPVWLEVADDQLRILPSVVLGLDLSVQAMTFTTAPATLRRVAFVPGIGYGLRVAFEGQSGWSVAAQVLLVSSDARAPAAFIGLTAGYVFRLLMRSDD